VGFGEKEAVLWRRMRALMHLDFRGKKEKLASNNEYDDEYEVMHRF